MVEEGGVGWVCGGGEVSWRMAGWKKGVGVYISYLGSYCPSDGSKIIQKPLMRWKVVLLLLIINFTCYTSITTIFLGCLPYMLIRLVLFYQGHLITVNDRTIALAG